MGHPGTGLERPAYSQVPRRGGRKKSKLYALKVDTWEAVSQIPLNKGVEDIAISRSGKRLYLLTSTRLVILDASELRELGRLDLAGLSPRKLLLGTIQLRK